MSWSRGIGLKLALIFLFVGLVPMAVIGFVAYSLAKDSITKSAIETFVQRVAVDTANNLEAVVENKCEDARLLAYSTALRENVYALNANLTGEVEDGELLSRIRADLNDWTEVLGTADLIAVVRRDGRIIVTNSRARPTNTGFFADVRGGSTREIWQDNSSNPLADIEIFERSWWPDAARGDLLFVDVHREDLVLENYGFPLYLDNDENRPHKERAKNPEAYSYAITCGIPEPEWFDGAVGEPRTEAILVVFHNWSSIQDHLDVLNKSFEDQNRYESGYTFMFGSDLNTIIAHHDKKLIDGKLVEDHGLKSFREAMRQSPSGVGTHRYRYQKEKISGYATVGTPGWAIGFGINEEDFNQEAYRLRRLIIIAGLVVALLIIILVAIISPRVTRPIRSLIAQAKEIARGNLDARVRIDTHDEIQDLGSTFNKMAEDLKESNEKLIGAEKKAAWQEMARQIAHEIKNPLTPMKLSAQLLERAYRDQHEDFPKILKTSVHNIVTQVESLRKIASDFSDFAAFPQTDPQPTHILNLIQEVVGLYSAQEMSGIAIAVEALANADVEVFIDSDAWRRVLINLFNNAFEAMPEGGRLTISVLPIEDDAHREILDIRVKDTGRGIPKEIRERLFEPYFTTRSKGTGLGLAITKRIVESDGGAIAIQSVEGEGTSVNITLPIHDPTS